jgi:D-glycero-alpha-D-manno-heptose-7-phosphate kinase
VLSNKIIIRSPTRVDLAGGTLDCWPLYLIVGHPTRPTTTVNLAVDIFTHVELTPREDKQVRIESKDLNIKKSFNNLQDCLDDKDMSLELIRLHLHYWKPEQGFELVTRSESPVGAGLGGSSSLTISLLKAFSQWMQRKMEWKEMVVVASNIEAQVLKTPTGTQDYIAAIWGGLNLIDYSHDAYNVKNLQPPKEVFEDRLLLIYTGKPHHSGMNNWQVIKSVIEGNSAIIEQLESIRKTAEEMKQVCLNSEWQKLPGLFQREYEARIRLTPAFTSPEIEGLKKLVTNVGAEAIKICGAGGGGCVFVWCQPESKAKVAEECVKAKFQVLGAKPVRSERL